MPNLLEVIRCIKAGHLLDEKYYRQSPGRDYLLEEYGWLHLHIGHGVDDNVLLIVEQTETAVILIALTDHTIFKERPRARSLAGLRSKLETAKLMTDPQSHGGPGTPKDRRK